MLKRQAYSGKERVASCNIANLIKPDTVSSCMLIENVPKFDAKGPLFYSLKDSRGNVLREGKTERRLSGRIREYKKESWFLSVRQVCVQPFSNHQQLGSYERAKIGCDCPPHNKQLKTSCP